MLLESDFTPINFGILHAKKNGIEFIFQHPFAYDSKRAAQNTCILFIGKEQFPVANFQEALGKANDFLKA